MSSLKLIVPPNFLEFGKKVDNHLKLIRNTDESFLFNCELPRFNNTEGKAKLIDSAREKDVYILSDVTNYDITYPSVRGIHNMSVDEHAQDIRRIINASCNHHSKLTLITPYLPYSRQDKKNNRESLDCAMFLDECKKLGVDEFVTFDAHNQAVCNAIYNEPFENLYPTDDLLLTFLKNEKPNFNNLMVVSPDEGAMKRASVFSDMLDHVAIASFYKERNYEDTADGCNPIMAHKFLGIRDLTGKTAILVDDMIDSGTSILKSAKALKERNADKVYFMVTFALLSKGIDKFNEAYNNGYFDKLYATNLSYVPEEYKNLPWFESVDCSLKVADLVNKLNNGDSIKEILDGRPETKSKIKQLKKSLTN